MLVRSLDLYEVLGISENASKDEIELAFRQRAAETHPHKISDHLVHARKRFVRLQEAYEMLSDPLSRAAYHYERENSPPEDTGPQQPNTTPDSDSTRPSSSPTEPSDPLLRYIPEEYIARNKQLQHPQGISTKDINDYILLAMKKAKWEENGRDQSLVTLLCNLFKCLAYDESRWGNTDSIPDFGYGNSAWYAYDDPQAQHYVQDFYEYWLNFKTRKTFAWVKPYSTDMPVHLWVLSYVCARIKGKVMEAEKKNKEVQWKVQEEYNNFIRTLVDILLRGDPRFMAHVYVRFHKERKPPTNDFYDKFVHRCRARAVQYQLSHRNEAKQKNSS